MLGITFGDLGCFPLNQAADFFVGDLVQAKSQLCKNYTTYLNWVSFEIQFSQQQKVLQMSALFDLTNLPFNKK